MMGKSEDPPGVNELAAFIVSSVKEEIADTVSDVNDAVGEGRFDADRLIDEAVLLRAAKEQIAAALLPITKAVVDRAREDLNRGLNA
jgi:hypothetical protein